MERVINNHVPINLILVLMILACVCETVLFSMFSDINKQHFNIGSYNCNSLKSSFDYVNKLVHDHDVLFVCEHWLQEYEISGIRESFKNRGYWSYMKSSMDPLSEHKGRPYGVVGFLCNSKNGFVHNLIECKSDRICGINVYKDNRVIFHIVGLYLPYYDGTKSSLDSYIETLDQVQCSIHNCSDDVPIILVGDMNTSLPREKKLPYKWFCQKPYSKQSAVLYDFLQDNNRRVANFMDEQVVHYTYQKGNTRSYIDNILVLAHIAPLIRHCRILHRDADNVSDHLALSCNIGLETLFPQKEDDTNDNILKSVPKFPKPQWSVSGYIQGYEHHLRSSLEV